MRAKLTIGFSRIVALVLLLSVLSTMQLREMHRTTDETQFAKATAGVTGKWRASDIGPFAKRVVAAAK